MSVFLGPLSSHLPQLLSTLTSFCPADVPSGATIVLARRSKKTKSTKVAKPYEHTQKSLLRPDVGLETQFKQRKSPANFRYDSSLSPELSWDESTDRDR